MPKVSIIVPVFNMEKYLSQAMESLINQTLKDIEIICINDGSTDRSLKILEEYKANDSRIIILNQENQGQGVARNNGIKMASGEYLGFLDPDDWCELTAYEKLYNQAKKFDADLVECPFYYYFESTNTLKKETKYYKKSFFTNRYGKNTFSGWLAPGNKLLKTSFIKSNNIWFGDGRYGEDQIFSIKSRLLAKKNVHCEDSLFYYRYRDNSCSRNKTPDFICLINSFKNTRRWLIEKKFSNKLLTKFYKHNARLYANTYNMCTLSLKSDLRKLVRESLPPKEYRYFIKKTKSNLYKKIIKQKKSLIKNFN